MVNDKLLCRGETFFALISLMKRKIFPMRRGNSRIAHVIVLKLKSLQLLFEPTQQVDQKTCLKFNGKMEQNFVHPAFQGVE